MPYKILKGFNSWEIIVKDITTNEEFALKNKYKSLCPICFYPESKNKKKECHIGIQDLEGKFSFITGHFYETDYKGIPLNWFGKLLKDISTQPFKHSHELISLILQKTIINSIWNINEIQYATMVPTTNQQMEILFSEISKNLKLQWIPFNKIFMRKELVDHYKDRKDYVNNKYFLEKNADVYLDNLERINSILIFDDIFHQGYTFRCIIELLQNWFDEFRLVTIARTVPKTFLKAFYFPH